MKNRGIIIGVVVVLLLGLVIFIYPNIDLSSNSGNTQDSGKIDKKNSQDNDNKKTVSIDDVIKVKLYDTVSVGDLEIELYSVDDSRCPQGVNCYWEGELKYNLSVNKKTMELGMVTKKEDTYGDYIISLDETNNSTEYVLLNVKEN